MPGTTLFQAVFICLYLSYYGPPGQRIHLGQRKRGSYTPGVIYCILCASMVRVRVYTPPVLWQDYNEISGKISLRETRMGE